MEQRQRMGTSHQRDTDQQQTEPSHHMGTNQKQTETYQQLTDQSVAKKGISVSTATTATGNITGALDHSQELASLSHHQLRV